MDTNIKAHNFIPAEYWKSNFRSVKEALLLAEVYVYEYDTEIQGFIGLNDEYVEGIFVSGEMQSQGIGKILLNYAKDKRNKLHLNVYQKNARAISFYKREGFEIQHSGLGVIAWLRPTTPKASSQRFPEYRRSLLTSGHLRHGPWSG